MKRFIINITGASGVVYGLRLIEALLNDPAHEVHLTVSPAGARVLTEETGLRPCLSPFYPRTLFPRLADSATTATARLIYHPFDDIGAPPASGTFRAAAQIICPCSMRTLASAATGLADNLITRTADVSLKEGRPLVIIPRETPLSTIHLENMLRLARAGAILLPASPAFYAQPQSIDDLVRFIVQKIFDRLGIEFPHPVRWGTDGDS